MNARGADQEEKLSDQTGDGSRDHGGPSPQEKWIDKTNEREDSTRASREREENAGLNWIDETEENEDEIARILKERDVRNDTGSSLSIKETLDKQLAADARRSGRSTAMATTPGSDKSDISTKPWLEEGRTGITFLIPQIKINDGCLLYTSPSPRDS